MNRRDLLKRAFAISAAGLLVPKRRVWALDRTMIPNREIRDLAFYQSHPVEYFEDGFASGWFDASMLPFTKSDFTLISLNPDVPLRLYGFNQG